MDLDKRLWYVRWFFWSHNVWLSFARSERDRRVIGRNIDEYGTNLCQFMRTIFVWAPLAMAANLATYMLLFASVTLVPIRIFGLSGYVKTVVIVSLAAGFVGGVIYLYKRFGNEIDALTERVAERSREAVQATNQRVQDKRPRFLSVLWGYVVAMKQQICPFIRFQ